MNDDQCPDEVTNNDESGNNSEHEVDSQSHSIAPGGNDPIPCSDSIVSHSENNSSGEPQDAPVPMKKHPKHTGNIYDREYVRVMNMYNREIKGTLNIFNSIASHELSAMKELQCIPDLSRHWDILKDLSAPLLQDRMLWYNGEFDSLCAPNIIIPTPLHSLFDVINKFNNDIDTRLASAYGSMFDAVDSISNPMISIIPKSFSAHDHNYFNGITSDILSMIPNAEGLFKPHDFVISSYLKNAHFEVIDRLAQFVGDMCQGSDILPAFPEINEATRLRSPPWSDLIPRNTPRQDHGSYNDSNPPRCEIEELLEYAKRRGWSARRLSKALDQWISNNHPRQQSVASKLSSNANTCGQRMVSRSASRDVLITDHGGTYRIRFDGDECIINKSKGLAMIKILTDHPDKFFSCFELQFYASKGSIDRKLVGENDATARRYGLSEGYQRYQERRDEILEATESNAWDQKSELEIKHEEEVSKLLGGQRGRTVSSERTRSRIAVKNAITHALKKIEPVMPKLERHLHERVQTGHHCRYLKLSKYN